jgi:hypothetical protein
VVSGTTDVNGEVALELEPSEYVLRASYAAQPYVAPSPYSLTVEKESESATIHVEVLTLPSADNPLFCRCSGYLYTDEASADFKLSVTRERPQTLMVDERQLVFLRTATSVEFEDNYASFQLLRGATYKAALPSGTDWKFVVPDLTSADVSRVLFPRLKLFVVDESVVSISVGEEHEVGYDQQYESGLNLDSEWLQEFTPPERQFDDESEEDGISVLFSSSDETVVTVSDSCGVVTLLGVGVGEATISVRVAGPWAAWCPGEETEQEWEDLITVTVTE